MTKIKSKKFVIIIPARYSSSRLPGKPLKLINNKPLIYVTWKNITKTVDKNIVYIATDSEKIKNICNDYGMKTLMTSHLCKTGSDRVSEASNLFKGKLIINLQGDEPDINKDDIINLNNFMINQDAELGTLAAKIQNDKMFNNKNVVKVITDKELIENNFPEALNFTRDNLSTISQNIYHHIGIYSYKTSILEKFVSLDQTSNEKKNKLEQLRALDNKLKINVALAKFSPIGVDTEEDYLAIKKIMEYKT